MLPLRGRVVSMSFYGNSGGGQRGPRLVGKVPLLRRPPLVWEVVKALETRISWPDPDDLAGYVAALGATRGQPLPLRVPDGKLEGEIVSSQVFGGRPVSLKITQLRALLDVYR